MLSNRNKVFIVSIALLSLFFSLNLPSQQERPRVYNVAGVSVEGAKFADPRTIIAIAGISPGDQLTIPGEGQTKLQLAIKNLWKRKQFSDVEIAVEKTTEAGVFLVIKVKEYPRLKKLIAEGNEELTDDEIKKAAELEEGQILSDYDLYLAKKKIKKAYADEGLMFAKVKAKIEELDSSFANLIVEIDEGAEYKIAKIDFEGNSAFDDDELISDALEELSVKTWWKFWKSSKLDLKDYEKDKENIVKFYRKNGFIDAQLLKDTILYDDSKDEASIIFTVFEGKRYYVRDIKFVGNSVYPENVLLKRLDFKKGDVYNLERFEMNLKQNEDQTDVTSLYADHGYLAAQLIKEEKRIEPDSVDITVKVYENQRVKIRRVDIVGNTKTKDKVIRRELYTRPGDYFNRSAVIRSVRALGAMQYFNPEALKPDLKPVDNETVDLVYKVEERSTDQFNASIGYMGTFGLTGSIGLTLNNFSLMEPLRGGGGEVLNVLAEFGQANRYQQYSIGFTEPWLFDEPTTVGFNLYYTWIRYVNNLNVRRKGATINFGRRFYWPDDYFRGDWSLRIQENYSESSYSSFYNYRRYYRPGLSNEVTIGQIISRTSYNNMFFPSYGSKFSFSNYFAMGALGLGNTDFLKSQLRFDIVSALAQIDGQDRLVLYLSSNVGYISTFKSDTMINPIELYTMGGNGLSGFGVTPLRGYPDQSIGPKYGGKVMEKYVAELRFAITLDPMPIYFYGFAEAGNVWGELKEMDPFDLKRSAGVGVQLFMRPLGIIGFSYGYGFDPTGETGAPSGWKFLFHLGQQF